MNDAKNRAHRAPKYNYWAVLTAAAVFAAAVLLTACPPEPTDEAPSAPLISYCGVEGITSLTLAMPSTAEKLSTDLAATWSSGDESTAEVAADGTITLKKATAANAPVLITATSDGMEASFELSILAAGVTPNIMVHSEADLRLMGCADGVPRLGATYTLANDITLTKEWEPIGSDVQNQFTGTLDGAGHTIKNLVINKPGTTAVGLIAFNGIGGGGIKNIGVELGEAGITGNGSIGALVGNNGGYVSGVVTGPGGVISTGINNGGLVGYNRGNRGTVIGYSSVTVSAVKDGDSATGGLVGGSQGGTITGYATGNVNGLSGTAGLVGQSDGGTVVGYYVQGSIQGGRNTGALIGSVTGTTLVGYARSMISVSDAATNVGRVVGYVDPNNPTLYAYYSRSESVVTGATSNIRGASRTITASTTSADFDGFTFSTANGAWTFYQGKWPSINFPADQDVFDDYRGDKQPIDP